MLNESNFLILRFASAGSCTKPHRIARVSNKNRTSQNIFVEINENEDNFVRMQLVHTRKIHVLVSSDIATSPKAQRKGGFLPRVKEILSGERGRGGRDTTALQCSLMCSSVSSPLSTHSHSLSLSLPFTTDGK